MTATEGLSRVSGCGGATTSFSDGVPRAISCLGSVLITPKETADSSVFDILSNVLRDLVHEPGAGKSSSSSDSMTNADAGSPAFRVQSWTPAPSSGTVSPRIWRDPILRSVEATTGAPRPTISVHGSVYGYRMHRLRNLEECSGFGANRCEGQFL